MNPFAALESDDEEEVPKVVQKKKEAKKTTTETKPQSQSKTPPPAPVEKTTTTTTTTTVAPPVTEKPNSGRGSGQGRGNHRPSSGRGGRGDNKKNGGKPVKHEGFDRHSGTGRGKEVSKSGSGKGNWGNPKEEAEHAEKEHLEELTATAADTPSGEDDENAPGAVIDEVNVEIVEPETPTFTLDQYLQQRDSARSSNNEIFGEFSVRKVDTNDFNGLKTKEDSNENFMQLGTTKVSKEKKQNQRSAKSSVILDVGFSVAPSEVPKDNHGRGRGGNGRGNREGGGRGGGRSEGNRGRGGRGGNREGGSRRNDNKVDINDSNAFPAL